MTIDAKAQDWSGGGHIWLAIFAPAVALAWRFSEQNAKPQHTGTRVLSATSVACKIRLLQVSDKVGIARSGIRPKAHLLQNPMGIAGWDLRDSQL